jgi:hypothetical protein
MTSTGKYNARILSHGNSLCTTRYGFINATYINSTAQTPENAKGTPKRVATTLFRASQEPRKRPALKTLRLSPSAPEMLKSPLPEMTVIMRDKENTRSRKWKEMAVRSSRFAPGTGTGMEWSFVTTDSKLISRTWKGIPDCWRGAAWHAFLSASAEARQIGKSDAELISIYNVGLRTLGHSLKRISNRAKIGTHRETILG